MDQRTVLRELKVLAVGAGEPSSPPRRPWLLRRFGMPLLLLFTLLMAIAAQANAREGVFAFQVTAVVGALPLAFVWSRPLIGWRIAVVAAALAEFFPTPDEKSWPWAPVTIMVYIAVLLAVAATQRIVVSIGVWVVTCLLVLWEASPSNRAGLIVAVTVMMLVGDQIRRRRRAQSDLRSAEERGAVLAERTRIARELHDVVAHHMSMIAVRAETAQYRLGDVDGPVREEFGQISAAARDGLAEMRRLLGVLRSENQETLTAPQPGLADLADLVETARAAGATVTFEPLDDADGVPPAVELTAYRIVQEALSNAGRHAPGSAVTVVLTCVPDELDVTVRNGPTARPPTDATPAHGLRHGLRGMRERAAMLDGELTAGPAPDGGFEVHAVLPFGKLGEGDR